MIIKHIALDEEGVKLFNEAKALFILKNTNISSLSDKVTLKAILKKYIEVN